MQALALHMLTVGAKLRKELLQINVTQPYVKPSYKSTYNYSIMKEQ